MEKTFNPAAFESKWYQSWEKNGYFKPSGAEAAYSIMIPPPNVTGSLHMGHGFQDSIMDALIRYHRMMGLNTLWQVGTDHAGISTQMVVERQIEKEGLKRQELGREKFVERIWQWKHESGNQITQQLRRMGASVDWSRERFTLDNSMNEAVYEVFIRLFDEGLIYRGHRLVNWDPHFRTAISDLEVNNVEEAGSLWHIAYPLSDGSGQLIVATTRPETLLGDAAVAVHPEDSRYQKWIGKTVKLPLTDREIPIIADEYVDKEFGSGCVKITPAHDFNDYQVGERHHLPKINIFTEDAKLNDNAPLAYRGMDRFDARKQIIEDLTKLGLLIKIEPHTLKIPRADRGNTIIEPMMTHQWYVKMKPLAEPALEAVRQGQIRFVPENWHKTYYQWLENIEDWCISRQLWWGHRIPAWYDDQNQIYVGRDEQQVRKKYNLANDIPLRQDEDVLDTWFSSALWPFATLGWPQNTSELQAFYPTSVLVSGFDIIFFWIARMIMMGLKFTGKIPFHEVYITGLIRDSEGHKMSKSKGNVLDPIDLIDGIDLETLVAKRTKGLMQPSMEKRIEESTRKEFPEGIAASGTDALRFTYCALASTGRDIRFDLKRLEGYRNFCNKIWNAARYVLMNVEGHDFINGTKEFSLADRWILTKLQKTIELAHHYFKTYRFDLLTQALYEFIWNEYCDWYLELSKPILNNPASSEAQLRGTRWTLTHVLESILKLCHPIMPFITEEIWQSVKPSLGKHGATIMLESYPQIETQFIDPETETEIEWLKSFILGIRNIRGEMNVSPSKPLAILLHKGEPRDKERIVHCMPWISFLARVEKIAWHDAATALPPSAIALVEQLEIHIPLAGLIDKQAEIQRLQREIDKITKDVDRSQIKLTNPSYVEKAPAAVVEKEKQLLMELTQTRDKLQTQLEQMQRL